MSPEIIVPSTGAVEIVVAKKTTADAIKRFLQEKKANCVVVKQ